MKDALSGHFGTVLINAKLAEKRALRPFGVGPVQATQRSSAEAGVPTEGSSKPFPATFLEDDEELDKADGPGDLVVATRAPEL